MKYAQPYTPERFDAQLDLLTNSRYGVVVPTPVEDIYRVTQNLEELDPSTRGIVVITGPSGAGKDSIIEKMLEDDTRFVRAKTATTRERRDSEAIDAMTWMRGRHEDETDEVYIASLVEEYGLVESSLHHGDVYGLPLENLQNIPPDKIPVLNTDPEGIASLQKSLRGKYSLVSIMVCPDNAQSLESRLRAADRHSFARLTTALGYLASAPSTTDYILVNRESDTPRAAAAELALRVQQLLRSIDIV